MPKVRPRKTLIKLENHVKDEKDTKIKQEPVEQEVQPIEAPRRLIGQEAFMEFRDAVLEACRQCPEGRVTTYGHIAQKVGYPRHSRHVGRILKEGGWPQGSVPWQRIINSSGKISWREARGQCDVQAELLQQEGVEVRRDAMNQHSISLNRFGWFE